MPGVRSSTPWAICIAGISELIIGARFARMGIGYGGYAIERLIEMTDQPLRIVSGVLHDECAAFRLPRQARGMTNAAETPQPRAS